LGRRLWFSTETSAPNSAAMACWPHPEGNTIIKVMLVLDEELLMELALWGWVVIVLWATPPNYD
jgi:hypothetical protein